MLRKLPALAVAVGVLLGTGGATAEEGMWMLHQIGDLDQSALQRMGLQLTPTEIRDLAPAVVSLGGCSASFVSPEGLIATNHHCAFGALQTNATPEHDYITTGFPAGSRQDELQANGTRAYVFDGYGDVTENVTFGLPPSAKPEERARMIEEREKTLVASCEQGGERCRVAEMFGGAAYYLFRTLELRDVRLVYAPPRSIGEFGGEIDNWMWPRQTGDFSFLRAYVGPDGKPADYSPANVPYHPKRYLRLASTPLREGDFTMILGYPGRTYRYETAAAIQEDAESSYPERITLAKDLIAIHERESKRGKDVEIKLASTLKRLYNGLKKSEGIVDGMWREQLPARARAREAELRAWIAADPRRATGYGDIVPRIDALVAARHATHERDTLLDQLSSPRSTLLLGAALTVEHWTAERTKADLVRESGFQDRDARSVRQRLGRLQRSLDLQDDRTVLRYLFTRAKALPVDARVTALDTALRATGKTGEAAIDALLDALYGRTTMGDARVREAMFGMSHASLLAMGDAMIAFAAALRRDLDTAEKGRMAFHGAMTVLEPRYIAALGAWRAAPLYPDANSTLRFTYATVKGYSPRDAVAYLPFTTLHGVLEKCGGSFPFNCPQALVDAAKRGPFPAYEDPRLHDVPACFLTTNDITGGNSGSPVMNGKGELVGLAFDGNYEAMTSDFAYDPAIQRTIGVRTRYMLWVMDYVDRAHELMQELGVEPQAK
ncbi:MAG: S46 family peptidase [Acidobacteriota bacterium]